MEFKKLASHFERKKMNHIEEVLLKEELYAEKIISIIRLIIYSVFFIRHIVIIKKIPEMSWHTLWPSAIAFFFSIGIVIDVWSWGKAQYYKFYTHRAKYVYTTMDIILISYFLIASTDKTIYEEYIHTPVFTMTTILFMALFTFFIILSIFRFNPKVTTTTGILAIFAFMGSYYYLFQPNDLIEYFYFNEKFRPATLAFFPIIIVVTILSSLLSYRLRKVLIKSKKQDELERFLPDFIAKDILNGDREISTGGNLYTATILFSDIRNFTGMSENQSPQEVVDFLNTYLNDMIEIIFRYEGVLDKIVGDGIMAIFGAPFYNQNAPRNAVRTAIDMNRKLEDFNAIRKIQGLDPIQIGIGIHTGEVVMGNVGSLRRMEFTAIGDAVNTASRLENYTKEAKAEIIISENTLEHLDDTFETQILGDVWLKGKKHSVKTYKVLF